MPHIIVKAGSHIFGDIFLKTRLLGISLRARQQEFHSVVRKNHMPSNICSIIHRQSSIVLEIRHLQTSLKAIRLCISDIRAVEEGAEKQEGEDWKNSAKRASVPFLVIWASGAEIPEVKLQQNPTRQSSIRCRHRHSTPRPIHILLLIQTHTVLLMLHVARSPTFYTDNLPAKNM